MNDFERNPEIALHRASFEYQAGPRAGASHRAEMRFHRDARPRLVIETARAQHLFALKHLLNAVKLHPWPQEGLAFFRRFRYVILAFGNRNQQGGSMVRGIAHICIRVADLDATRRFYCDALGLRKAFDFLRDGRRCGFYLGAGERNYLEFFQRNPEEAISGSPIHHFCLEVDSIEQSSARLKQAGFAVTDKTMGADHSWQAWTTDPDGVKIELHEYTPDSCQKTGRDCLLP